MPKRYLRSLAHPCYTEHRGKRVLHLQGGRYMFQPKEYPCKCHVCGREFVIVSEFLSCASWCLPDGREVARISCNADRSPKAPRHTDEEIRAAWAA